MTATNIKAPPGTEADHALTQLPREDLDLILELVLQSGSLKDLASAYSVSYPTIRARLDRTIERLRALISGHKPDPVTDLMADMVARGELSSAVARRLRDAIRKHAAKSKES
jgi:hypothetical protein